MIRGYRPDFRGILGHEFVGIVEASDEESLIGKRVVGELNEGCGDCIYCKTGREKHCLTRKVIGMEGLDGTFEEYFVLANHLIHVVPDSLPTEKAIYVEPLAAALEIPNQIHFRPEDNVAVIGDGRLALMVAQVVSLYGLDLTIIGKHEEKLKLFENLGNTDSTGFVSEEGRHQMSEDTVKKVEEAFAKVKSGEIVPAANFNGLTSDAFTGL